MTRYLTDGQNLYEVASQRIVQNYGLAGGTIGYTILRDAISEETAPVSDLVLLALTEVHPA